MSLTEHLVDLLVAPLISGDLFAFRNEDYEIALGLLRNCSDSEDVPAQMEVPILSESEEDRRSVSLPPPSPATSAYSSSRSPSLIEDCSDPSTPSDDGTDSGLPRLAEEETIKITEVLPHSEGPPSECRSVEVESEASGANTRSTSRTRNKRTSARKHPYARKPTPTDAGSHQAGPSQSLPRSSDFRSQDLSNCEVCLGFQQGEAPEGKKIKLHFKKCHYFIDAERKPSVRCTWPGCNEPMLLESIGKHYRSVHREAMKKQCDRCSATFSETYSLNRHRKNNCPGI